MADRRRYHPISGPFAASRQSCVKGTPPALLEVRGEVYLTKTASKLNAERSAGEETFQSAMPLRLVKQLDPRIVAKRPLDIILYGWAMLTARPNNPNALGRLVVDQVAWIPHRKDVAL